MKGCPYVGPRPFGKEDAAFFRGRERESRDLVGLIQAHPVVLVYAPSGAGKTSLLSATVAPQLEKAGCFVLPLARVGGDSPRSLAAGRDENVFSLNVLASLQGETDGKAGSLRSYLENIDKLKNPPGALPALSVLVIDQFEEIFTKHIEAWEQRQPFFEALSEALTERGRLRIVFAMREEYLASLDPYRHLMPGGLETTYRLSLLDSDAALRAVKDPASEAGVQFEPGVAEELVASLRRIASKEEQGRLGEYVEPLQLQVVCKTIWDALPENSKSISGSNVSTYGNVDAALRHYYDETIRLLMARIAEQKINTYEVNVREWIEDKFILPDGTRDLYFMKRDTSSRISVHQLIVNVLDDQHVVRPEMRAGARWYELSHDRFVQPIQASNAAFREKGSDGLANILAHVARSWQTSREKKLLLSGQQLKDAEALIARDEKQFPVPPAVRELVRESRTQANAQASDTWLKAMVGVAGVCALAVVLATIFFVRRESLIIEERSKELADVSRQLVQGQTVDARIAGLLYAVLAVERSVRDGREPPAEAMKMLATISQQLGPETILENDAGYINALTFSEDGKTLVVSGYGGELRVDARSGKTLERKQPFGAAPPPGAGASAPQSPSNAHPPGGPPPPPPGPSPADLAKEGFACCAFSADGKVVLATGPDKAKTLDPETFRTLKSFTANPNGKTGFFSVDAGGEHVIFTLLEGGFRIWDAHSGADLDQLETPQKYRREAGWQPGGLEFSNDGKFAWLWLTSFQGVGESGFLVWKVGTRSQPNFYKVPSTYPFWNVSAGGKAITMVQEPLQGTQFYLFDLNQPPPSTPPVYITIEDLVIQPLYLPHGMGVVTETQGVRTLRVWDLKSKAPTATIRLAEGTEFVALSPDMKRIATIRNQVIAGIEPLDAPAIAPEKWGDADFLIGRGCNQLKNQKDYTKIERSCSKRGGMLP